MIQRRVKTGIRAVVKFVLWVVVAYGLMILVVMGLAQFGLVLRGYFN